MERSTSVTPNPGEPNLTPGEQRILSLMERNLRLMEQRMRSLEEKLGAPGQELRVLSATVEYQSIARTRQDQQLAEDVRNLRKEFQDRDLQLLARIGRIHLELFETLNKQGNTLREQFLERFDQFQEQLATLRPAVRLSTEQLREHRQELQGLRSEVRRLADALELKADVSRVEALEQRLGE